jgi:PEP-CTERM motif
MRKLLLGLAAASGLAMASAANAELTIVPPTTVTSPPIPVTGDGGFHFTFGYHDSSPTNPFEQLVSFNNDLAGFYGLGVQTTATTLGDSIIDPVTDVDFSNVFLTTLCSNAAATATPGSCGTATLIATLNNNSTGDVHEDWSLSGLFLAPGSYTIHIAGTRGSTSSFDGNLNFAQSTQLPEPGTWAMMLLGFGAVGWQIRRRRGTGVLAQAA